MPVPAAKDVYQALALNVVRPVHMWPRPFCGVTRSLSQLCAFSTSVHHFCISQHTTLYATQASLLNVSQRALPMRRAPSYFIRSVHTGLRPPTKHGRLEQVFSLNTKQPTVRPWSSSKATGYTRPGDLVDTEEDLVKLSNEIPRPRKPKPMVEVTSSGGIRGLLGKLFARKGDVASRVAQSWRLDRMENKRLNSNIRFLGTDHATPILYWYCLEVSFLKSDFARLLPDAAVRVGNDRPELDNIDFEVTRARDPINLTRWMGYFLKFPSSEAAMVYYQETQGSELGGLALKLKFVEDSIRGFSSPLLEKVPGLARKCHALMIGLPHEFSQRKIAQTLWEYDLIEDEVQAIERLPVGRVKYGGNPFLLRFQTEDEASRFVRDFNQTIFPGTEQKVFCEIID